MSWMIYGANGYTGRLVAEEAARRGLAPVLAGRNHEAILRLGEDLGLETRVFSLDGDVAEGLAGQTLVLHCAGPFSATSAPMLEACLATGVHYLDITGEIDVFEHAWRQDTRARLADVLVCPGVGFDVVPTDCLAASLLTALPSATTLVLAFEAGGGPSRGTARTSLEGAGQGGRIRRDGELLTVPTAWKTRTIPFRHQSREAVTIPWGDVFTAWVSTGVPNIEVYMAMSPRAIGRLRWLGRLAPLLRFGPVRRLLKKLTDSPQGGPDQATRERTSVEVWGRAGSADGRTVEGTLSGPNGYDLTVTAALGIVEQVLSAEVTGGYTTPSLLMGEDYVTTLPGVRMTVGEPFSA